MGPVIEVSIAVCLEKTLVDKILDFEIHDGDDDDVTVTKLALIASAIKQCAESLRLEYRRSHQTPATVEQPGKETWHLPRPSIVPSLNSPMPALEVKSKLSRNNVELVRELAVEEPQMRSLFLADYTHKGSESAVEAVVKFVTTYGTDAQHLLSAKGYAPKLYDCVPVIGRRIMVIMERVNGKPMNTFPRNSLPSSVFEDIAEALNILHARNIVFGDLRDMNVMVLDEDSKGRIGAQLIDFDWADKNGKAFYPATINPALFGLELHKDVSERELIRKEHDNYSLNHLRTHYLKK